ncbi:hypothetical protein LTS08_003023 [Lithohypha guttulata]|uniref:Uncharacterized protein n=1 Tax=Lithohypha guttulata TaxID=1690604 RepID=A0AAN7Y6M0_9EURO|nr:hypothetical protein LTR51_000320 [Lithohypha guttulata]KAK5085511.1 hypothetical protein LTR05_004796 [Lithohypha guttulata]KAK5103605.1 hypothetical protein LTS08_003023 [Lithohypha guttulata]
MARKLPWASAAPVAPKRTIAYTPASLTPRPPKRQHIQPTSPIPDEIKREIQADLTSSDLDPVSPRRNRAQQRLRNGRTPSTSPPPAPPTIEILREGLDGDDVYVMVEDEFQAVAQGFTAHLHHAEYKRLMREAKERKRAPLPDLVVNIPFVTRARMQRQDLEGTQAAGLKDISAGLLASSDVEDVDGLVEEAEKEMADPWTGTTLAGLMNADPAKEKTSLKGLEKLTSGSRAARGLMPNSDTVGRAQQSEDQIPTATRPLRTERNVGNAAAKQEHPDIGANSSRSSKHQESHPRLRAMNRIFDDDYGTAESTARSISATASSSTPTETHSEIKSNKKSIPKVETLTHSSASTGNSVHLSSITRGNKPSTSETPKSSPKKKKSFFDDLDDFDVDAFDRAQAAAKMSSQPASQEQRSSQLEKPKPNPIKQEPEDGRIGQNPKKRDRSRYDEIPVFLIG